MKFYLSTPILSYRINIYKPQESNINSGRQLHFNRVPEFIVQMFVMKQMKVTFKDSADVVGFFQF